MRVTGFPPDFVRRLRVVLMVINSGQAVDADRFEVYAWRIEADLANTFDWSVETFTIELHHLRLEPPEVLWVRFV